MCVATALVTLFLLLAQYVPDFYTRSEVSSPEPKLLQEPVLANVTQKWLSFVDLLLTVNLILLALITYISDWIQTKLMERRIIKINQYLQECEDAYQKQLEATLRILENATSKYNLLLHLMLGHHRFGPVIRRPTSHCFIDKELNDMYSR